MIYSTWAVAVELRDESHLTSERTPYCSEFKYSPQSKSRPSIQNLLDLDCQLTRASSIQMMVFRPYTNYPQPKLWLTLVLLGAKLFPTKESLFLGFGGFTLLLGGFGLLHLHPGGFGLGDSTRLR